MPSTKSTPPETDTTQRGDSPEAGADVTFGHGREDGGLAAPIQALRDNLSSLEPVFERHFRGAEEVTDPQRGPLRDYYDALSSLLKRPDLPAQDRGPLERRRAQTIRLLHYRSTVAPRFAARYAKVIRKGFSAVGLPVPDFAKLSRAEALEHVEALHQRIRGPDTMPSDTAALLPPLIEGLRELRSSVIPDAWFGADRVRTRRP